MGHSDTPVMVRIPYGAIRIGVLIILLLLTPFSIPAVSGVNVTMSERVYYMEEYAVPIDLWFLLIILGFAFLVIGVISDTAAIPFSLMAFMCFLASAYAAPMTGIFTHDIVSTSSLVTVIPSVTFVAPPWSMFLLFGFAVIALINIWRGVLYNLQQIKYRTMEDM